jgi:hypothetical protein
MSLSNRKILIFQQLFMIFKARCSVEQQSAILEVKLNSILFCFMLKNSPIRGNENEMNQILQN